VLFRSTLGGSQTPWFNDVANYILTHEIPASTGCYWSSTLGDEAEYLPVLGTAWALMTLEKVVPPVSQVPQVLSSIVVSPPNPSVPCGACGGAQQFTAQGYDQYNQPMSGLTFIWSCTDPTAGSIGDSTTGFFTAGSAPDSYHYVIQASSGGVTGNTSVTVTAPNTPAGSPRLLINSTDISYAEVDGSGCTRVTTSQTNLVGATPSGFRVISSYIDITTTATYTSSVTVGISYDPASTSDPQNLKLFHWQGGQWVDVTTSVDQAGHVVSGTVTTLSPFFIGDPAGPPSGPSGGGGVPVFPSVYIGIGAALGAAIVAYFVRRRLVRQG
jgi:hypothetical protein